MQAPHTSGTPLVEQAGYFEIDGEHLYTVLHAVPEPLARVLLIGSFAADRNHSYLPWARWARYLAARQIEVMRFDYRGVGESTGCFEHMTFSGWSEDVRELAAWLDRRSPGLPLLLHGLSLGALFAARLFDRGVGDALLLWAPPPHANALLRSVLVNWITLEKLSQRPEQRRPLSAYLAQLEAEGVLEVNGYRWSIDLWRESFGFTLPSPQLDDSPHHRPVSIVPLGRNAAPLVKGGLGGYEEANDLEWLFSANYDWIASTLAKARESCP